jgi:hypothetical protein
MNGINSIIFCVLIVVLGNGFASLHAKAPEEATSPNSAATAEKDGTEKSLLKGSNQPTSPASASAELCQCVDQNESAAMRRIEQALNGPLHSSGIQLADTPLISVLMQLQDEYQIPIQLDTPALEQAGVGADSPVTRTLHNISLRSALKLTLEPLKLTWMIRDEVLMVTTTEAADRHLVMCVYNVQGLVDDTDPEAMDGLIDAITACAAPDSWSENGGGQANIRPLKPGLLVISQTPAHHEEVKGLMEKIRKIREQVPITNSRQRTPERASNRPSSSKPASSEPPAGQGENANNDDPFSG